MLFWWPDEQPAEAALAAAIEPRSSASRPAAGLTGRGPAERGHLQTRPRPPISAQSPQSRLQRALSRQLRSVRWVSLVAAAITGVDRVIHPA